MKNFLTYLKRESNLKTNLNVLAYIIVGRLFVLVPLLLFLYTDDEDSSTLYLVSLMAVTILQFLNLIAYTNGNYYIAIILTSLVVLILFALFREGSTLNLKYNVDTESKYYKFVDKYIGWD